VKKVRVKLLEGDDKGRAYNLDEETPVMKNGELMLLRRVPADTSFDLHWRDGWIKVQREDTPKYRVTFDCFVDVSFDDLKRTLRYSDVETIQNWTVQEIKK